MNVLSKYTLVVLTMASLTACLEVKDNNNNDDLVAALQQQNDILTQQNDTQNTVASLTLTGKVTNISNDSAAQNATVVIKVGNDWSEPVIVANDGSFELTTLPFSSDYTLIVQSSEQGFLSRTFYGTTRSGNATGITFQDLGSLSVSEGELKSLAFLDSETNSSILGLELYTMSHVIQGSRLGAVSDYEQYFHKSAYNEATEQYEIMLPIDIAVNVYGSLDVNGDNENDYQIEGSNYYYDILVSYSDVADTSTVYLIDQQQAENNIEFRISILDNESNVLKDLMLSIDDEVNGEILSTFDEVTEQYIITANLLQSIRILLPAFNVEGQAFDSGMIYISPDENQIRIQTYGYNNWGNHSIIYYYVPIESEVVDVVFQPKPAYVNSTEITLVSKTTGLNTNKTTYKAFYSQPIGLQETSVTLVQKNVISVLRGNDSNDDLILPGSTLLSQNDVSVTTNAALSLNNTQLTVVPESALQGGYSYQYLINDVIDSSTELAVDISNDNSEEFTVEEVNNTAFDINSLTLDNNNYYNNGEFITAENTAGEVNNAYYSRNSALLLIPSAATSMLKSLTIQKMVVTAEGNISNNIRSWTVINDGQFYDAYNRYALSTANNEVIISENYSSYNLLKGLASLDGFIHYLNMSESMYDNTSDSENTITFEYAYETLAGEIFTGQLTLEVQ